MECTASGLSVMDLNFFVESRLARVEPDALSEDWFWSQDPLYFHPIFTSFKRLIDITFSLAGLVAFAPLFPVVALLIKLQDGGPIFYSQTRVGHFNKPFTIYKLRTMKMDAESGGAKWASKTDTRVTWVGKLLRKTRLDEVPQFWNVLLGDMSLIGPRPERPELVDTIAPEVPFYRYRHLAKPGITGWAQINYPYGASVEDARRKLTYDLYYLKNASFTLDLQIILGTFMAMVKGAR
jgi:exopolysaccharide biosynthesis polyprenyl glycosylphosphotransferase